jgi:hypothetical protein
MLFGFLLLDDGFCFFQYLVWGYTWNYRNFLHISHSWSCIHILTLALSSQLKLGHEKKCGLKDCLTIQTHSHKCGECKEGSSKQFQLKNILGFSPTWVLNFRDKNVGSKCRPFGPPIYHWEDLKDRCWKWVWIVHLKKEASRYGCSHHKRSQKHLLTIVKTIFTLFSKKSFIIFNEIVIHLLKLCLFIF